MKEFKIHYDDIKEYISEDVFKKWQDRYPKINIINSFPLTYADFTVTIYDLNIDKILLNLFVVKDILDKIPNFKDVFAYHLKHNNMFETEYISHNNYENIMKYNIPLLLEVYDEEIEDWDVITIRYNENGERIIKRYCIKKSPFCFSTYDVCLIEPEYSQVEIKNIDIMKVMEMV